MHGRAMERGMVSVTGLWLLVVAAALLPVRARAQAVCGPTDDPCRVTTAVTLESPAVVDIGSRHLVIDAGGSLSVGAGDLTIRAGQVTVAGASTDAALPAGVLLARGSASADGGNVTVDAGAVTIAGEIDVTGASGGAVALLSDGEISVGGTVAADRLSSDGGGGTVDMTGSTIDVSGSVSVRGATFGFGGDITIRAAADLTVAGRLDLSAGDGGEVELAAGFGTGSGNLVLMETSVIDTSGKSSGLGGGIGLDAQGDGITSGHITLDGVVVASGGPGTEEEGGGDGGTIDVTATGDVVSNNTKAEMTAEGGRPDGFGGEIEILAVNGVFTWVGAIDVEGDIGALSVDARGDTTVGGAINAKGEGEVQGGDVQIEVASGGLTVTDEGSINVSEGGSISLIAGTVAGDAPQRLQINGPLAASGGWIELTGNDSVMLTESDAPITAEGVKSGGDGGSIIVTSNEGRVQVSTTLSVKAKGTGTAGGSLSIEAETVLKAGGVLDASGAGRPGGTIGLRATGPIEVTGTVLATTTGGASGGDITVISGADVDVSGTLRSDGGPEDTGTGGKNEIEGCQVTVRDRGALQSLRPNGINRITGREGTVVFGTITADPTSGRNEFRFRDQANAPAIFGSVTPEPLRMPDPQIPPCTAGCGNGVIEPPEACDDGNLIDGDGCSRNCEVEVTVRGDANGDMEVRENDLSALIEEVFDGDGDQVGMVGSPEGTFPGAPGADANEDGRITAADIIRVVQLLAP